MLYCKLLQFTGKRDIVRLYFYRDYTGQYVINSNNEDIIWFSVSNLLENKLFNNHHKRIRSYYNDYIDNKITSNEFADYLIHIGYTNEIASKVLDVIFELKNKNNKINIKCNVINLIENVLKESISEQDVEIINIYNKDFIPIKYVKYIFENKNCLLSKDISVIEKRFNDIINTYPELSTLCQSFINLEDNSIQIGYESCEQDIIAGDLSYKFVETEKAIIAFRHVLDGCTDLDSDLKKNLLNIFKRKLKQKI